MLRIASPHLENLEPKVPGVSVLVRTVGFGAKRTHIQVQEVISHVRVNPKSTDPWASWLTIDLGLIIKLA